MSPQAGAPAEPPAPTPAPALAALLRGVARRYPVPALPADVAAARAADAGSALAFAIEHARVAQEAGRLPAPVLEPVFVDALARLVDEALRTPGGDAAFQSMLLQRQAPAARAFASLSARAERDRRDLRARIDTVAHPQKLARRPADALTPLLAALHDAAQCGDWPGVADAARRLQGTAARPLQDTAALAATVAGVLGSPALARLLRLQALGDDDAVRRWRALQAARGPAAGTPQAAAQGAGGQRRGDAGEARVAAVLDRLAQRLGVGAGSGTGWRAVTSLLTPPVLAAGVRGAKTEWDVALLHETRPADGAAPVADLGLLVEVKASADAAVADWPRLLRGLQCLAGAQAQAVLPFACRQGTVALRGDSLRTLVDAGMPRPDAVLYVCTDETPPPRLLAAASRLQLLSAPAVLAFAAQRAAGNAGEPELLRGVWQDVQASERFEAVRQQLLVLRAVRARMVHVEDLEAAAP